MSVRILVVEDDETHRETLARHLRRSGYEVTAVEDAERALGSLAVAQPRLVLTDVRMPGMSGLDLLGRVRQTVDLPVVVMTAYGQMQDAIDAMKMGAFDYLTKPLDLDRLDEVLQRCIEQTVSSNGGTGRPPAGVAPELIGCDPRMIEIYKAVGAVASSRTPVLIRGETGTGKELVARMIHQNGANPDAPFVAVNCTAVPEPLLESELFGHVRGAFTGAVADRKGKFELAGSGTIFLDEIGDTNPGFQAKMLRVLQDGEYTPLGREAPRRSAARVIAATHRPVEKLVEEERFREDLYFRLRVVEISIPPLRERRGDIPLLAAHFVRKLSVDAGRELFVPDDVMAEILAWDWPGNVRELQNALTRAAVLARGSAISLEHLQLGAAEETSAMDGDQRLESIERAHVQRVLTQSGNNKSRAAQILGVSRPRLDRMIARHGIVT